MCNFLSGLTFGPKLEGKFGKFYSDPQKTDSHTEMESALGIKDKHEDPLWAKWEFTPNGRIEDFDNYSFRIDEVRAPSWWTDEIKEETIAYAKKRLAQVVLASGTHEVKEGKVIAAGSATVRASGSATVEAWDSATVRAWDSATVEASGSATVEAWGSATVEASDSATVEASDSATVTTLSLSVKVSLVKGSFAVLINRAKYGERPTTKVAPK